VSKADVMAQDETPTMAAVAAAIDAPEFILPWLDRLYDEEDGELVLAAAMPAGEEPRMASDGAAALAGFDAARLERAVRRGILDRDDAGNYAPTGFRDRLEIWAMFEGWKDVPLAVHRELAEWDVGAYAETIREDVQAVRDGRPGDSYEARYAYVLLAEAEAIVAAQERIYLWPCDCRSLTSRCRKPMDVCLRFENDRGLGWEISRERAVAILRSTDKAGLMHTADLHDDPGDTAAICNCCTDCCYPHLATERLGMGDVWPVRRHVAHIDADLCTGCGRCGRRCPFAAIVCATDGRPELHPSLCRGCGLCATGCSPEAIELRPVQACAPGFRP
jgi:Pyruvate/2-oxoacid:ferredoxin oxidoreductase delta subunit